MINQRVNEKEELNNIYSNLLDKDFEDFDEFSIDGLLNDFRFLDTHPKDVDDNEDQS